MNAHTFLFALILVLMALNGCEPMMVVKSAQPGLSTATIYLHAIPALSSRLALH